MCKLMLHLLIAILVCGYSNAELVGFWTFDGSASGEFDLSGAGNNASLLGNADYTDDSVLGPKSLLLDGDDSYVELFASDDLIGDFTAGKATLSMWVKLNAQGGQINGLATMGSWSYPSFYSGIEPKNISLKLFLSDGEPVVVDLLQPHNFYQWNHFAITVDANDDVAGYKVYVNGQLSGHFAMNGQYGNFLQPKTPRIGISYDAGTRIKYYMNGMVDEVKIYNNCLDSTEIKSISKIVDLDNDGNVNYTDMVYIADKWGDNCSFVDWCGGVDFDRDGVVGISDIAIFGVNWLR